MIYDAYGWLGGVWGDAFLATGNIGYWLLGRQIYGEEEENPLFR